MLRQLICFKRGMALLDPGGLVQVSMDGPNVNWKFYRDLFQERRGEELTDLLNIGSCGLHVVHGLFQRGAKQSGWNLANILRSLWQVFHVVPARREDFIQITGSDVFPLQFCQHRWVEDIKVADRALQIWPHVDKYVKTVAKEGRAPTSVSFFTLISACDDVLIQTKLQFFVSVAKPMQEFLTKFQTEAPMAPFLGSSLKEMSMALMGRFLKKKVWKKLIPSQNCPVLTLPTPRTNSTPKKLILALLLKILQRKYQRKKLLVSYVS